MASHGLVALQIGVSPGTRMDEVTRTSRVMTEVMSKTSSQRRLGSSSSSDAGSGISREHRPASNWALIFIRVTTEYAQTSAPPTPPSSHKQHDQYPPLPRWWSALALISRTHSPSPVRSDRLSEKTGTHTIYSLSRRGRPRARGRSWRVDLKKQGHTPFIPCPDAVVRVRGGVVDATTSSPARPASPERPSDSPSR